MNEITAAFNRLFERHRIIFWYDSKQESHTKPGADTRLFNFRKPGFVTGFGEDCADEVIIQVKPLRF